MRTISGNFFNSITLQPPGSQPGQLDARLAFFYEMVKFFSDAGVKIILGTDSPGHVGVMSGFSVHENLRLYSEIGLSAFKAYEAGSSTPGQFLTESLNLNVLVGRVLPGYRADLILLEDNPLSDVVHLQEPDGGVLDLHLL